MGNWFFLLLGSTTRFILYSVYRICIQISHEVKNGTKKQLHRDSCISYKFPRFGLQHVVIQRWYWKWIKGRLGAVSMRAAARGRGKRCSIEIWRPLGMNEQKQLIARLVIASTQQLISSYPRFLVNGIKPHYKASNPSCSPSFIPSRLPFGIKPTSASELTTTFLRATIFLFFALFLSMLSPDHGAIMNQF